RQHYSDFSAIFSATSVREDVLCEDSIKYLETSGLGTLELYKIYSNISGIDQLDTIRADLLYRFARALYEEPLSEQTFALFKSLGREMTVNRLADAESCYEKINALYADQFTHMKLAFDTNGMDHAEQMLHCIDRPRLVTFSKTRNDPSDSRQLLPFFVLGWVETLKDGKYKSHTAYLTGDGTSEGTSFESQYATLYNFAGSGCSGNSSWGSSRYFSARERNQPGALSYVYEFSATNNTLSLEVFFNDNAVNISRRSDGVYFLNKERLTKEELHERLQAKHEQAEKFGLYVSLKKSDQSAFKELIADLPRPSWIKYNDLSDHGSALGSVE
ncbi:MAG: hypothetical protein PF495_18020, partial [Spirochaetales bacterium]|nr:hypothetical protein [Spirochaetales bacterium]